MEGGSRGGGGGTGAKVNILHFSSSGGCFCFVGVAIVGVLVTWVVKLLSRLLTVIDGIIAIGDAGHLKRTFKELFPSICFLVEILLLY